MVGIEKEEEREEVPRPRDGRWVVSGREVFSLGWGARSEVGKELFEGG